MMITKVLSPLCTISNNPTEVFSVRFSEDGSILGAGCSDGVIRIYSAMNGASLYELKHRYFNSGSFGLPITALRFRPESAASKAKNVILAGSADGSVCHWHITSGKCLHRIDEERVLETGRHEDNQVLCVDYRLDGKLFATAGKDRTVRVYDEATKSLHCKMRQGMANVTPGHSNRVFSLKFNPDEPNNIVTGGWDNTVQIWDIRTGRAVRSIFGPHICGDAVDVYKGVILTGSWRTEDQIQLWDFSSGELIETVPWHQNAVHSRTASMIYCAEFSKGDGRYIAAGGSGANEAKVFDRKNNNELIGTVSGMNKSIFALDFDSVNQKLVVAGGDTALRLLQIVNRSKLNMKKFTKKRKSSEGMLAAYRDEQKMKSDDEDGAFGLEEKALV